MQVAGEECEPGHSSGGCAVRGSQLSSRQEQGLWGGEGATAQPRDGQGASQGGFSKGQETNPQGDQAVDGRPEGAEIQVKGRLGVCLAGHQWSCHRGLGEPVDMWGMEEKDAHRTERLHRPWRGADWRQKPGSFGKCWLVMGEG